MNQRVRIHLQQADLLPAPPNSGAAQPTGFRVLAISAGDGNGWHFRPRALQQSLPLWEGVDCFIDHSPSPAHGNRSIRGGCNDLP